MSLPQNERKVRAGSGRGRADAVSEAETFAEEIARALEAQWGGSPSKVKTVARLTRSNEKTVKNWFAARNGPNGDGLVALMRQSDEVLAAVLRLAGREALLDAGEVQRARLELRRVVGLISVVLGDEPGPPGREGHR